MIPDNGIATRRYFSSSSRAPKHPFHLSALRPPYSQRPQSAEVPPPDVAEVDLVDPYGVCGSKYVLGGGPHSLRRVVSLFVLADDADSSPTRREIVFTITAIGRYSPVSGLKSCARTQLRRSRKHGGRSRCAAPARSP